TDQAIAHVDAVLDQLHGGVHHRHGLIHAAAALELQDAQVDQGGQESMLAIELAVDAVAQHTQIARLQHGLLVFRQEAHSGETHLAHSHPPAHKELAQPEKEKDVLEILNCERIGEVGRWIVEYDLSGP